MIQKIMTLQDGDKELKTKLKMMINDLKNVIEFKEKHSSVDKEAFKNAIQINDYILPADNLNNNDEMSFKAFQAQDNNDKVLFLLFLIDSFLKRDNVQVKPDKSI